MMTAAAIALLLAAEPRLVVVDTVDVSGKDATLARLCTQILVGEATSTHRYSVMGSAEIQQILGIERQRQLLGCSETSQSCLAELSGALGADFLLSSQLARVGSMFRLDVRLVDAQRGTIIAGEGDFFAATEEAAATGSQRLARSVFAHAPGAGVVKPPAPPEATAPPPPAAVVEQPATPRKGHSLVSKIVLGVAAAAVLGAGTFTVLAGTNYASLGTAASMRQRAQYDSLLGMQQLYNPLADGFWAGAAVAAAVGLILWFVL